MKIIYLISRARVCGPVNQASYILRGLIQSGDNATLCTIAPEFKDNSRIRLFRDNNINVFCLGAKIWLSPSAILRLRRFVKREGIEVIHSSGLRANLLSSFMPKSIKKISTQRSSPIDIGEKFPKYMRGLITRVYLKIIKRIPINVACSKSLAQIFQKNFSMNIPYVQNGIDTDTFKPVDDENKKLLKEKIGIDPNKKTYIILGSLNVRKNNDVAIEAFNKLCDDNSIQLIIVGSGVQEHHLKDIAKSKNIVFCGKTASPLQYLQAADALISCSLAEGLPNTVLEALSCGLPCILSDIGPHRELIENTDAGTIYHPNSSDALIDAMLKSKNWAESKSESARQIALQNFSIEVLAGKYRELYRSI